MSTKFAKAADLYVVEDPISLSTVVTSIPRKGSVVVARFDGLAEYAFVPADGHLPGRWTIIKHTLQVSGGDLRIVEGEESWALDKAWAFKDVPAIDVDRIRCEWKLHGTDPDEEPVCGVQYTWTPEGWRAEKVQDPFPLARGW